MNARVASFARNAARRAVAAPRFVPAAAPAKRLFSSAAQKTSNNKAALAGAAFAGVAAFAAASTVVVSASEKVDYEAVRTEISQIIEKDASWGPTFVRLAWHAAGTYDKKTKTGGSNGATMRYAPESTDGANAGLDLARNILEPIKSRHPGISYADLWTLSGVVAIEEMDGPVVSWRSGRSDTEDKTKVPPNGRLPAADKGASKDTIQHMRDVFYRMGFNDREIVALLGAHAVGRCHTDRSGYWGPWTRAETTFSNEYFRELLENKWTVKKTHLGQEWKGPLQYEDPTGDLMMLPADLALIWDPEFKKYVEIYAKDEEVWHKDFAAAFSKLLELNCNLDKSWWKFW